MTTIDHLPKVDRFSFLLLLLFALFSFVHGITNQFSVLNDTRTSLGMDATWTGDDPCSTTRKMTWDVIELHLVLVRGFRFCEPHVLLEDGSAGRKLAFLCCSHFVMCRRSSLFLIFTFPFLPRCFLVDKFFFVSHFSSQSGISHSMVRCWMLWQRCHFYVGDVSM
jgi:hypothetical protein